jgi:GNAT superfamily N-acetyltransferase
MVCKIINVKAKTWERFQPFLPGGPCCNMAFPSGTVFALLPDDGTEEIASMVWYTYPFYHTNFRDNLLPELRGLNEKDGLAFINKNVKLLARVSTLPKYRGMGYAYKLISRTLPELGVKYIECLTAHDDIRRLLIRLGFEKISSAKGKNIDYWLRSL